jgi:hypothetical protein
MLERPCTSLKTLHATCYTRARQSRLNGSVSAEPSTRDGVRTRPHSFNAAAAGKCSWTIYRIPSGHSTLGRLSRRQRRTAHRRTRRSAGAHRKGGGEERTGVIHPSADHHIGLLGIPPSEPSATWESRSALPVPDFGTDRQKDRPNRRWRLVLLGHKIRPLSRGQKLSIS